MLFKTKKELEYEDKIFDMHRSMGLRCVKISSHEELIKLDPKLAQSKNKYAGGILLPDDSCIDTFDFGSRIMAHAEQMGVAKLMNTKFETFIFAKGSQNKRQVVGLKTS